MTQDWVMEPKKKVKDVMSEIGQGISAQGILAKGSTFRTGQTDVERL